MSALLVARILVRDPEKLKSYSVAAASTVAAYGGEVLARGTFAGALLGEGRPHITGVMRFPSDESIQSWFASADYQALASLRDAAGEMEFLVYHAL